MSSQVRLSQLNTPIGLAAHDWFFQFRVVQFFVQCFVFYASFKGMVSLNFRCKAKALRLFQEQKRVEKVFTSEETAVLIDEHTGN